MRSPLPSEKADAMKAMPTTARRECVVCTVSCCEGCMRAALQARASPRHTQHNGIHDLGSSAVKAKCCSERERTDQDWPADAQAADGGRDALNAVADALHAL